MQMNPYLSFNGHCEDAFNAYAKCFGGQVGPLFRYAGSPMADQAPADWGNKIMHGSVTLGPQVLMGADVTVERYEKPQGISLSLHPKTTAEAERVFGELAQGGQIVMPLAETFWAARFGMLIDRFGIPWMINCEAPVAKA